GDTRGAPRKWRIRCPRLVERSRAVRAATTTPETDPKGRRKRRGARRGARARSCDEKGESIRSASAVPWGTSGAGSRRLRRGVKQASRKSRKSGFWPLERERHGHAHGIGGRGADGLVLHEQANAGGGLLAN